MIGVKFKIYGTTAHVVNYDDVSGKYIYKITGSKSDYGYMSKENILENIIK